MEKGLFLLGLEYEGGVKGLTLKLLDPKTQKVRVIADDYGHKPYCYIKSPLWKVRKAVEELKVLELPRGCEMIPEKRVDPLTGEEIEVVKVTATNPYALTGARGSLMYRVKIWEADVPYHLSFLYDLNLTPSTLYTLEDGFKALEAERVEEPPTQGAEWIRALEAPVPQLSHLSLDIEVPITMEEVSTSEEVEQEVSAIALVGSDGRRQVYLLERAAEQGEDYDVKVFEDERELLAEAFKAMEVYPVIATFNGDGFDLPYLANRAKKLGIPRAQIPIRLRGGRATLKHGIHLDLYRFLSNRSIQAYVYNNAYRDHDLDSIARAILGEGKVRIDKPIAELSGDELARYCFQDALLVHKLLTADDHLVIKLLVVLSRICRMPIEDVCRQSVSGWIKSLLYYEHRRRGLLIPRGEEILKAKGYASTKPIIRGKKYRGGIVIKPTPGVHFDVTVLDFASLYPSIIKKWNLSYETVRCPHPECRDNRVPETDHWVCGKQRGIQSQVIGALRDLRVKWCKPKSMDQSLPEARRRWYDAVQKALKVVLNASYGVFGFEGFPLYCPPLAESIAALGRYAFKKTVEKARGMGLEIIYGDTDSVFVKNASEEQITELITWVEGELGLDLEVDKRLRYAVFTRRKKSYIAVDEGGEVIVRGLMASKSNAFPLLTKMLEQVTRILRKVEEPGDVDWARGEICDAVWATAERIMRREAALDELAFAVTLTKDPREYEKDVPHVRAVKLLNRLGIPVSVGSTVRYVKAKNSYGVAPLHPRVRVKPEIIDYGAYVSILRTAANQILEGFGTSFEELIEEKGGTGIMVFY